MAKVQKASQTNKLPKKGILYQMKKNKLAYGLIAPALIAMIIIHVIPIISGICMSFLKLNQFTLNKFLKAPFI